MPIDLPWTFLLALTLNAVAVAYVIRMAKLEREGKVGRRRRSGSVLD